jgi:AraC-like DNA-binding protein
VPTWTNATPTATTAGVLRADELARHVQTRRLDCSAEVAPWVENYWTLSWSLPDGVSVPSQVVPHPACSLTVERGHTRPEIGDDPVVVTGVVTSRFDVEVSGRGWVLGVKFRPGGLAALTGRPAGPWRDRVLPAAGVVPGDVVAALRALDDRDPTDKQVAVLDATLSRARPLRPDPRYTQLLEIVADLLADRSVVSVAQIGQRHGLTVRALQRLFQHYVGVGPKWVLARYRMHDVLTELDAGYDASLADLAHRYGWYDQAHFIRDFVATTGVTPGDYARRPRQSLPAPGST